MSRKATFDEGYILERQQESLRTEPMLLTFGGQSPSPFDALCLPGCSLACLIEGEGDDRVGVIAIAFDPEAGLFIPMAAPNLRNVAAGLCRMADILDGGKGKQ